MQFFNVDILIVGAGVAGLSAGYELAQGKVNTLVLERCALREKDKLCGGAMTAHMVELLKAKFGTMNFPEFTHLDSVLYIFDEVKARREQGFCLVERSKLDAWLLAKYQNSGGKVLDNFHLTHLDEGAKLVRGFHLITKEEYTICYRKLIAADGAASTVRRLVTGRVPRTVLSLEIEYPSAESYRETVLFFYKGFRGYVWNFAHSSGANLGILDWDTTDVVQLRERLNAIRVKLHLPERKIRGAFIPLGDDLLLEQGDILFVGDAAGLIDPISGGGIQQAVLSGLTVAQAIVERSSFSQLMETACSVQEGMRRARIEG